MVVMWYVTTYTYDHIWYMLIIAEIGMEIMYLWPYMVYANNSWKQYGIMYLWPYMVYANNSQNLYGNDIPRPL